MPKYGAHAFVWVDDWTTENYDYLYGCNAFALDVYTSAPPIDTERQTPITKAHWCWKRLLQFNPELMAATSMWRTPKDVPDVIASEGLVFKQQGAQRAGLP